MSKQNKLPEHFTPIAAGNLFGKRFKVIRKKSWLKPWKPALYECSLCKQEFIGYKIANKHMLDYMVSKNWCFESKKEA